MITIIIPVYNAEKVKKKFKAAVDSVLGQSYFDIELLLINDGSTDDTKTMLSELEKRDSRIKVYTKENGGVESARRYGLKKAAGKYIMHMDQDDHLPVDALQSLVEAMERENADVVAGNSTRVIDKYGLFKRDSITTTDYKVLEHDELMEEQFISFFGISKFPVNIWGKLYRKSFIDSIPEPPLTGLILEDLSYNMHIFPYIQKLVMIPKNVYNYVWGGVHKPF